MTSDLPPQRPEGRLIQQALEADGRSIRQVAPTAGLSDARWRQIVKGHMTVKEGVINPVVAPPVTLARMAQAVGVPPEALAGVGREDAAAALEHLEREGTPVPPDPGADRVPDEIDLIHASRTMTARQKLVAIRKILELRAEVEREDEASSRDEASGRQKARNNHR